VGWRGSAANCGQRRGLPKGVYHPDACAPAHALPLQNGSRVRESAGAFNVCIMKAGNAGRVPHTNCVQVGPADVIERSSEIRVADLTMAAVDFLVSCPYLWAELLRLTSWR
jgi:hypothetical protein